MVGAVLEYARVVYKWVVHRVEPSAPIGRTDLTALEMTNMLSAMAMNFPFPDGTDPVLRLLRSAHLQRMARFGLVDHIPAPWGAADSGLETPRVDREPGDKD